MDKKKLAIWSLYDFANSIVMIAFFLYYSQWLVIEKGVSDFWFNMTFAGSSLLLLLTAPIAGSITDKIKVKMPGLRVTTALSFLFFTLTGVNVAFFPGHYVVSMFLFAVATYFYLFCFVFYNALLGDVAKPEKHGAASGWGIFGNYAGQMVGLLVTLPLVTGAISLWGAHGRAQALIPSAVLFFILALPMLLFFKENERRQKVTVSLCQEYRGAIELFKSLVKIPGLGRFFLAYFFFNDAVITASNNFPIYLEKVFAVSDTTKTYILVLILIASAVGAVFSGWVTDRVGHKKSLLGVLGGWVIIFILMAATTNFKFFVVLSGLMGLWFGAIWTVTRALVTQLTPPHVLNQSFTYYTLMERFATFIGPVSWGLIVMLPYKAGGLNYRIAALSMSVFVFLGLIIAKKLPGNKNIADDPNA